MKVLDPGHEYLLRVLDCPETDKERLPLVFVKREGPGYPGNEGHHSGTTTQEVLRALIDRNKYVDNQIPDLHTQRAINFMRRALLELEFRAAERHGRKNTFASPYEIEEAPVCEKCGHIGCLGGCH